MRHFIIWNSVRGVGCTEILNLTHGWDNHAKSKDSSTSETLELYWKKIWSESKGYTLILMEPDCSNTKFKRSWKNAAWEKLSDTKKHLVWVDRAKAPLTDA